MFVKSTLCVFFNILSNKCCRSCSKNLISSTSYYLQLLKLSLLGKNKVIYILLSITVLLVFKIFTFVKIILISLMSCLI